MSSPMFPDDILFFQRLLRIGRFYMGELDGEWGPTTELAAQAFESASVAVRATSRTFDSRTERNISTLSIKAQSVARATLIRIIDGGMDARVLSGSRTYSEQDALFKKGRFGNPGPRVTNARGGQSNHNFGIAWDIGLFTAAAGYVTDEKPYADAAALVLAAGAPEVEWGGSWKSFPDNPHYQLSVGIDLATLRTKFEAGELEL